jgi:O-antigen ligase
MFFFYWLVFIMPLENHRIWTRSIGGITVIKYLGLACVFYALLYWGMRKRAPLFFDTRQSWWFVCFLVLVVFSYVKGLKYSADPIHLLSHFSFLLLFFVTLIVTDSFVRFRRILMMAAASVPFAALYLLREWQADRTQRPGWVLNPNDYGAAVALCFPIALCLFLERRPNWERAFCLGAMVIMLGGLAVAASREGLLGLVVGLIIVMWHARRRLRKFIPIIALFAVVGLVTVFSPLGQRIFHPSAGDTGSTDIRYGLWTVGLRMIWDHPLLGVGIGMFKPMVASYTQGSLRYVAHNTYLEIAAEMGIPALLVYLMILFGSLRTLQRVRRQSLQSGFLVIPALVSGMFAGLIGASVSLFFSSMQDFKLYWLMMFLSMCLPSLLSESRKKQPQRPSSLQRLTEAESQWSLAADLTENPRI